MKQETKQLAVIILNWNGIELLKKFVPSAYAHTQGEEVDLIVADNGSEDKSVEWLEENYPGIKVLEFGKNYGFAEGYNKAIEKTGYPFTILLNSDVEVTPGWWKPLLNFMQTHPEAGAVQPKIKSFSNKTKFEYAGAAGGYLDKLGYPYCRGRLFDRVEEDHGQYDGPPVEVCWASGAALCVRTSLYLELGGLDPLFFAHMEEIDLCCRMWASGHPVFAISDSEIFHVGGASLHKDDPKKTYLNFRNNLLLLYKTLPLKNKKRKLIIRRLADSLAFLMFMAKFDLANAKAILRAHRDFKKMRKEYSDLPPVAENFRFPGSDRNIIIDRYLLNKKR